MSEPIVGASAASQAVANFAHGKSLKLQTGGESKTRTQRMIEQINAQASAELRSGGAMVNLSPQLLRAAVHLQARK